MLQQLETATDISDLETASSLVHLDLPCHHIPARQQAALAMSALTPLVLSGSLSRPPPT